MGMLEGRVAICTGAARGVGAEVAKMMAAHGAKIVVVDPGVGGAGEGGDQRPAQVTVDEIKAAGGEAIAISYSTPPGFSGTRCSTTCFPRTGKRLSMYT